MTKIKYPSGTIISIPLEHNLGFVAAKLINLVELKANPVYNELLIIYKDVFKNDDIDLQNINEEKLLVNPLLILDLPPVLKNKTWKTIGFLEPKKSELLIPDFKDYGPVFTLYEKDAKIWYLIKALDINKRIVVSFDDVRHLETFKIKSHDMISRRLTMETIVSKDLRIEDFYDLKEWKDLAPYYNLKYTITHPVRLK